VADALRLESSKRLLKAFYAGQRLSSPMGGFLEFLGVRSANGGGAVAFFECSASSLRYELDIPKATRTERRKVREVQDGGGEPDCPRHGPGHRLVRAGKDLVCPLCGVAYGKA
jgi:hypothetical protein